MSIKSVKESIKLMRGKLKELISDIGEQLEKEQKKKKKKALKLSKKQRKKEKSNDNADSKSKSESDLESQSESESESGSESESSSSSSENEEGTRQLKFLRTSMLAHVQTNTKAERRAFETLSSLSFGSIMRKSYQRDQPRCSLPSDDQ